MEPSNASITLLISCHTASDLDWPFTLSFFTKGFQSLGHAFIAPDRALYRLSCRGFVTGVHEVAPSQLKPIDADRFRYFVHLCFIGDAGLRRTEAAERTGVHVIRRNSSGIDFNIVDSVGTRRRNSGIEQYVGAEKYIGPGVRADIDFKSRYLAVLRNTGLMGNHKRVSFAVAKEGILTCVGKSHGAMRRLREQCQI